MKLYIEGGGRSDNERSECQRAFRKFFIAAGLTRMPRIVACGSRDTAYDKFRTDIESGGDALLLVDSEAPIAIDESTGKPVKPWTHLMQRDKWERPVNATEDDVHFMVESMESWFIADRQAFIDYYSKGNRRCNSSAIPDRDDIETLRKVDIMGWLLNASVPSGNDGYKKGSRSFDILSTISPQVVASKSIHARRLFCKLGVLWITKKECKEISFK